MSSAGIRKQLVLATQRVQTCLKQLSEYDKVVENEEEIEIMRSKVIRNLTLLEKGVEKINTTHDAWREFLAGLTGEAYERENKRYEEKCEASNCFLEVAEKGEQAVVDLKCRLAELDSMHKKSQIPVHQEEKRLTSELPRTTLCNSMETT
ncbi:unnamed protein product [Toxocara canis]|uniref:Uncharacterized protein n=1 Tax=Toxocara canis TaxID=6265 RepID=A0A183TZ31_TOXCA|nr:unnamed protein product [Toxocara canis]